MNKNNLFLNTKAPNFGGFARFEGGKATKTDIKRCEVN
jgi:hypothetical protein